MSASRLFRSSQWLLILSLCLASVVDPVAASWSHRFQRMGIGSSPCCPVVKHMTAWGDKLAVGGYFHTAGGQEANYIAVWNGQYWETLGTGLQREPNALFDRGILIAGGNFHEAGGEPIDYVAKWDPDVSLWLPMGEIGGEVDAFCEHFGSLYAGGEFFTDNPQYEIAGLAHWTGTAWEYPWGMEGVASYVNAMESFDGAIYFGGEFHWGGVLSLLGFDLTNYFPHWLDGHVYCLERDGYNLYVGGIFQTANGVESHGFATLHAGGGWNACPDPLADRVVKAMTMFYDDLYVATEHEVRRYDLASWPEPLGGTFDDFIFCLETCYEAGGLFVAGNISNCVMRWDDGEWVHLGGGIDPYGVNHCLVQYDSDVVAAGDRWSLRGTLESYVGCNNIARWDGDAWHPLGRGLNSDVLALAVYQNDLYAGGSFFQSGPESFDKIARWDGEQWHDMGGASSQVNALHVHQDELIAGGYFSTIGGVAAQRIAGWDGAQWRALGTGMDHHIWALDSYQGDLIAAGQFTTAGGTTVAHIARWDGSSWYPLGEGLDGTVYSLTVWHGDLIVGGRFDNAGDALAANIARWDGAAWHPLGGGVGGAGLTQGVTALQSTATDLFVGGDFTEAGGEVARGVAVWDGAAWSELGNGVRDGEDVTRVNDFLVRYGNLYVAGDFAQAGSATQSINIALWHDGTITPTLLQSFAAREIAATGRPRSVEVTWNTATAVDPASLRLTARASGHTWPVTIVPRGEDAFYASDDSPHLVTASEVVYTLDHHGASGSWQTLTSKSLQLSPPAAATRLVAVSPNPFNPRTAATFVLDQPGDVRLEVYALDGRRVATLAAAAFPAGRHTRTWDGRDAGDREVAAGTYVIRLETDSCVESVKVMLVR